jgi:hypothetical protein
MGSHADLRREITLASGTFRSVVLAFVCAGALGTGLVAWKLRHKVLHKIDRIAEIVESHGLVPAAEASSSVIPNGPAGTLQVHAHPAAPHPRILLTPARLAHLAQEKDAGAPPWNWVLARCKKITAGDWTAGYEAWDWAHAVLELPLCARMTHDPVYDAASIRYFTALLDDRHKAGDGIGGDSVITHDEGYSIRTHGLFVAIAYDWLHDAPGMTPALRKKAVDRIVAWTTWFKQHGYNADNPISNYYAGYFGTVAFGGIACEGDDPRCDALRDRTQEMWNHELVPTYRVKLAGGDFPEGWQYGDFVGSVFALFADSEAMSHPATPGAPDSSALFKDLPWLRDVVTLRSFALRPDGMHTYDNGDWNIVPPWAPPHTLSVLAMLLPPSDPAERQAEFLARLARAPRDAPNDDWAWLAALGEDPTRRAEDPRKPQTSYLSPGTATVFARGSLGPTGLWASLTSPPSLSDHQHLDAGHFEVYRGADPVFIDSGAYASYSSLSHNVVIVDDPLQPDDYDASRAHNDPIRFKRNQGVWSDTAHMARYEDGGGYVYALASYDSAFNNDPRHKDRAVTRAEREWVFSRAPVAGAGSGDSGRVVIYDRFTMSDPRFTTTFILHGGSTPPRITGPVAAFSSGASAAWVTTLLPAGAAASVADESHNQSSDVKPYFSNVPPDGVKSFRYEVASPASPPSVERRFLHAIVIGAAQSAGAPAKGIEGNDVAGAVIDGEAYLFSAQGPATRPVRVAYRAPRAVARHVVADLAPSAGYTVTAASDGDACAVTLEPASGGGGGGAAKAASAAGVLSFDLVGCAAR